MNLWAKSLGQLAVIAVALFFFSCEDDTISGYKTNPKFKVSFAEFQLPSSVVLLDSTRTSNMGSTETSRILVGSYHDGSFGKVNATAYSEFFTVSGSKVDVTSDYDSTVLELRFDFYHYGSTSITSPQSVNVYELEEGLKFDSLSYYFNRSSNTLGATLGSKIFTVDTQEFDEYLTPPVKDTAIYVSVRLNDEFGGRLWQNIVDYRDNSKADSSFVTYSQFIEKFKGLGIVAGTDNDKILGFTPSGSRLRVHYHTDKDTLAVNYSLGGVVNYSNIQSDRSGTDIAEVMNYRTAYEPGSDRRFIQAGTALATQLDLQEFLDFLQADSNENLLINEAQLVLTSTEPKETGMAPISSMSLRIAEDNALIRLAPPSDKAQYSADSAEYLKQRGLYNNYLGLTDGIYTVLDASFQTVQIVRDDDGSYIGYPTYFMQQLHTDNGKKRFRYYTLYPQSPSIGKNVNRVVFNKENVKLRIYYTRPI